MNSFTFVLCRSPWRRSVRPVAHRIRRCEVGAAAAAALLLLAGCGGGSASSTPAASAAPSVGAPTGGTATAQAATGVWEGTVTSQATGQTVPMLGVVDASGMSSWMTADGRVIAGMMNGVTVGSPMPMTAFVDGGTGFPNGATAGAMELMLDAMSTGAMSARMAGLGETFTMTATRDAMWNRPASLAAVAGVYSRATSSGYTVSMAIDANGMMTVNDSRGCLVSGNVSIPDPTHNLYELSATVSSCGALNGTYAGRGTLVDASAMTTWMQQMLPIMHAGSSGGGMMGGSGGMMPGHNTIPFGAKNLFMFMLVNDQHAMMDALAR